jgi:DNA-binding response OmpR family regulator
MGTPFRKQACEHLAAWEVSVPIAHAPADLEKHGIDLGDAPLLQKPFMPSELAARVREVLGKARP